MWLISNILKALFKKNSDLSDIRHEIINKALCIQGRCLSCANKNVRSEAYLEITGMCKQITDAASKL